MSSVCVSSDFILGLDLSDDSGGEIGITVLKFDRTNAKTAGDANVASRGLVDRKYKEGFVANWDERRRDVSVSVKYDLGVLGSGFI